MMPANKQQNHARRNVVLVMALVGLISAATLATGPIRESSAQANAQIWSYTGSLNTARVFHTATLLHDGKVLVVGGYSDNDLLASAELYDPTTGTWSFTGSLSGPDPAPTASRIILATVFKGRKLFITGENFHDDAVILLNGEEQNSKNDQQYPGTNLLGKKAGRKITPGDRLQVRNPDGGLSEVFIFTGSQDRSISDE